MLGGSKRKPGPRELHFNNTVRGHCEEGRKNRDVKSTTRRIIVVLGSALLRLKVRKQC
jgi:hypothetical protein